MKTAIVVVIVLVIVVGGLLALRNSRNAGMPGKDVLDRARAREREQSSKD